MDTSKLQIFGKEHLAVTAETQDAILSAYNNTIGKGIAPEAVPELLETLKMFIHAVEHEGAIHGRIVDAVRNASEAINKAKL